MTLRVGWMDAEIRPSSRNLGTDDRRKNWSKNEGSRAGDPENQGGAVILNYGNEFKSIIGQSRPVRLIFDESLEQTFKHTPQPPSHCLLIETC